MVAHADQRRENHGGRLLVRIERNGGALAPTVDGDLGEGQSMAFNVIDRVALLTSISMPADPEKVIFCASAMTSIS